MRRLWLRLLARLRAGGRRVGLVVPEPVGEREKLDATVVVLLDVFRG